MSKKKVLSNKVEGRVLKQRMAESSEDRTTISFYRYFKIEDPKEYRDQLYIDLEELGVLGRIYLANEGVNGQISIPSSNVDQLKDYFESTNDLKNLRLNVAIDDDGKSFFKLAIKVRKKIVADGIDDENFDPSDMGEHLSAEKFNELTDQEDTILVDMRNHYESEVGYFKGAILPDSDTFRDELPMVEEMLSENKDKNIVMYCTGGIRCEKASAYMRFKGFENVYQLEGGIIKYAQDVEEKGLDNKFVGKNFVFDQRVGERISEDIIANCHQCGEPCDTHVNCANDACHLLFIQCKECASNYDGCCSTSCQDFIALPVDEQKRQRKGRIYSNQFFKKGRVKMGAWKEDSILKLRNEE